LFNDYFIGLSRTEIPVGADHAFYHNDDLQFCFNCGRYESVVGVFSCRAALMPASAVPLPAESGQRLDNATLEMLAQASTSIECECPKHLVELIRSLASFETYSEQCSIRSELDATVHQDLQQTAGRARMLLEQSLLRLAMLEGLPLPEARG